MLNFNYSLALLIEYAAFVKLRIAKPNLHRPYRIPVNTVGCIILLIPCVILTIFIMALGSYRTHLYSFSSVVLAASIYLVRKRRNLIPNDYGPVQQAPEEIVGMNVSTGGEIQLV